MMRRIFSVAVITAFAALSGCAGSDEPSGGAPAVATADVTQSAVISFASGFTTDVKGTARAGTNVKVDYALDRLPDCRGDLPGGAPGWNVTGFVSENGGPARTFEVTRIDEAGKRVAAPANVALTQGGVASFWFQVHNRWGCSAYDSAYGQNYQVNVEGPAPTVQGAITFPASGDVEATGELLAGAKVRVRYEQERLPHCRRYERGNPAWTITGYASFDGAPPVPFQTGRVRESDRERVTEDAILELPRAGDLAIWFEVTSLGGCSAFDSNGGQNYRFFVR